MKFNIIKSVFAVSMLLCMALGFQSCKDDADEMIFGETGSELTLKYGVPYKIVNLPEITDDTYVIPGDYYNMGAIIEGGCVRYDAGVLEPYAVGKCVVKFYKDNRDNIIKTINIEVVPNYDIDKLIGGLEENLTLTYREAVRLINVPELPAGESVSEFLTNRGINLKINFKNGLAQYDTRTGDLTPVGLGSDVMTISWDSKGTPCKTVNIQVNPNFTVTMQPGETKAIADIIGQTPDSDNLIHVSDSRVAYVSNGIIHASQSGTSYIYVNGKAIAVTVGEYKGPVLFQPPYMSEYASVENIKEGMKAYTLVSETTETVNNINYTVLKYAPFGNSKSISYYVRNSGWAYFQFARVDTGKTANENYGWLVRDYSPYYSHNEVLYFEQPGGSYSDWRIYPVNDWSILELRYP